MLPIASYPPRSTLLTDVKTFDAALKVRSRSYTYLYHQVLLRFFDILVLCLFEVKLKINSKDAPLEAQKEQSFIHAQGHSSRIFGKLQSPGFSGLQKAKG